MWVCVEGIAVDRGARRRSTRGNRGVHYVRLTCQNGNAGSAALAAGARTHGPGTRNARWSTRRNRCGKMTALTPHSDPTAARRGRLQNADSLPSFRPDSSPYSSSFSSCSSGCSPASQCPIRGREHSAPRIRRAIRPRPRVIGSGPKGGRVARSVNRLPSRKLLSRPSITPWSRPQAQSAAASKRNPQRALTCDGRPAGRTMGWPRACVRAREANPDHHAWLSRA
jgi:hypothetical protein